MSGVEQHAPNAPCEQCYQPLGRPELLKRYDKKGENVLHLMDKPPSYVTLFDANERYHYDTP